jgi:hypothetical protein
MASMDGNFTVLSNEEATLLCKLKEFYKEICVLTEHHHNLEGFAVVYSGDLSKSLVKVKQDWWNGL